MKYAFIHNNLVGNIVDESKVDKCPADHTAVQLADGESCGIFWLYDESQTPRFIQRLAYNPNTQDLQVNDNNGVLEWQIVSKSTEEINRYLDSVDAQIDALAVKRLLQKIAEPILADEANLTEQDIADAMAVYKQYRIGVTYDKDSNDPDEKRFIYNDKLYKVIGTKHTSQADWTPDTAVSLYVEVTPPGVIAEWVQPTGAHDAYDVGAKVTWNGHLWENTSPANVYEPGVWGWTDLGVV